ncbi:ABC transporter substrate-binding protein [Pusillimonas caeni]|uniref:ABC transporter substrate-binding protein n=1 Tax=Pusillimonas caeni TaxID=1348472 RepID=UPI000E59EDA8|nr:ABC transporter substrate-binding protein [Pusillimonas caeni]TFL10273.1 ABC transporter substrate-binding protein [Pusillimonas caeni]
MRSIGIKAVVAALSIVGASQGHAADVIKIGVNQPLTGVVAAAGTFVAEGAKIAAAEINDNGGVLGKQIQLIIEDNKSNPTEASNVTEKLIVRDKVSAMMGAWSSTYTLASMPKLMEYKMPMLVETASSGKITQMGNPYVFRISPTSAMEAETFAKRVKPMDIKRVEFLVVNNDWGLGAAQAYGDMLKKEGVEVGKTHIMDAAAQDMTSQLSAIKHANPPPSHVFLTSGTEQITLVMKQAESLGLNVPVVTTGGIMPQQLLDQAGAAANNTYHVMFFVPWFPEATLNPEGAKSFISRWESRKLDPAGMPEGARGYDGIHTLAAAIERAGDADPAKITEAIWQTEFDGLTGHVKFHKEGPAGKESGQSTPMTYLVKIEDGKIVNAD